MRELHERILLHGAASLTDSELLGIVIDSEEVAQSLISQYTLTTLPVDDISRLG